MNFDTNDTQRDTLLPFVLHVESPVPGRLCVSAGRAARRLSRYLPCRVPDVHSWMRFATLSTFVQFITKSSPPRHTCPASVCDLPQLVHKINVIYVYSHIYTGNTLTYTRTHIRTQRLCTHRKSYECLHGSQRPGPPCRVCYQSECVATPFYVFPSPSSG